MNFFSRPRAKATRQDPPSMTFDGAPMAAVEESFAALAGGFNQTEISNDNALAAEVLERDIVEAVAELRTPPRVEPKLSVPERHLDIVSRLLDHLRKDEGRLLDEIADRERLLADARRSIKAFEAAADELTAGSFEAIGAAATRVMGHLQRGLTSTFPVGTTPVAIDEEPSTNGSETSLPAGFLVREDGTLIVPDVAVEGGRVRRGPIALVAGFDRIETASGMVVKSIEEPVDA